MPQAEPNRRSPRLRALVRSTRIRLCSVALALLGALILATSASAAELAVEDPVAAPSSEGVVAQVPELATVEAELPAAEAPTAAPEAPAPAPAPEAPAPSPAETPPAEAPPVNPPVVETPPVKSPVAPAPPEAPAPEVHVEVPAAETIVEKASETTGEKSGAEGLQGVASAASQTEITPLARATEASSTKGTQSLAGVGATPPGPPDAGLALGSPIDPVVLTTGSTADETAAPLTATAARIASATIAARKSAAFGAGPLDCAKALQANPGEGCSGWVVAPQLSESSILPLGAPDGPLPPDPNGGASAGGGHSVVSAPVGTSTPGPQPGGASGGASAAGGGGGLATSGFLTLAGLLLLAAPRAMRRLRLHCRPWRTTCFALIPERPG